MTHPTDLDGMYLTSGKWGEAVLSEQRFALCHDGATYLFLTGSDIGSSYNPPEGTTAIADFSGKKRSGVPAAERGWWVFDGIEGEPSSVKLTMPAGRNLRHYAIDADYEQLAEGPMYEATLTAEQYRELTNNESVDYDSIISRIYHPVWGRKKTKGATIKGQWLRLDGEPPVDDGLSYHAKLPFALAHRNEYVHLFPGYLDGFRGHAANWLEDRFVDDPQLHVDAYSHSTFSAFVKTRDGKNSRIIASFDTDGSRGGSAERWQVPNRIEGANRADARAKWDDELARLEALIRAAANPCPHCNGTGRA